MITKGLKEFFKDEASGGILLLLMAALAFLISNSFLSDSYFQFINYEILGWTLKFFVNDGLMTIFFYVVGLEIKKELFQGELRDKKKAALSIFGALGGMIVPALIYFSLNSEDIIDRTGWAIPMATDIAFALAILVLLGKRVPLELKIFLLSLAIVDDLGAIFVIALFYTQKLNLSYFLISLIPFSLIYIFNRFRPTHRSVYLILGFLSWLSIYKAGIHPTVAGVVLAFLTPFKLEKNELYSTTPLTHWLYTLHPPVTLIIMPLFALFNSGLDLRGILLNDIIQSQVSLGVFLGLMVGKPLGIVTFCFLSCQLKLAKLPEGIDWKEMYGVGLVAGIGFTMSLFINGLTFGGTDTEGYAKVGVLTGSLLSAILGYFVLLILLSRKNS